MALGRRNADGGGKDGAEGSSGGVGCSAPGGEGVGSEARGVTTGGEGLDPGREVLKPEEESTPSDSTFFQRDELRGSSLVFSTLPCCVLK